MLFEGLSRKHALRLHDITFTVHTQDEASQLALYYQKHQKQISSTVYKDAYYCFKFWIIIADFVKKTHSSLAYILRTQYRNSNDVYSSVKSFLDQSEQNTTMEQFIEFVLHLPSEMVVPYFEDVYTFLIMPVFKRYSIYSPSLLLLLYLDMMSCMADDYIQKGWKKKSSEYMINYTRNMLSETSIQNSTWLSKILAKQISDELGVFKTLRIKHHSNS